MRASHPTGQVTTSPLRVSGVESILDSQVAQDAYILEIIASLLSSRGGDVYSLRIIAPLDIAHGWTPGAKSRFVLVIALVYQLPSLRPQRSARPWRYDLRALAPGTGPLVR